MSIEITIAQRCGGEYGQEVYYSQDTLMTFTLDGNSDNAQIIAGYAIAGAILAHRGDRLLITVKLYGDLVARWCGVADKIAAEEFDAFVGWRMQDFAHTAQTIQRKRAA